MVSAWMRVGSNCWHVPTGKSLVIAAVMGGGRYLLLSTAGQQPAERLTAKTKDVRRFPPRAYPRNYVRRVRCRAKPKPLEFPTDEELQTAAAWGITPAEVRQIQKGQA